MSKVYDIFIAQLFCKLWLVNKIIEGGWPVRSVSNVKAAGKPNSIDRMKFDFAPQKHDVCNQALLRPCLTQVKCTTMLCFRQQLRKLYLTELNYRVELGLNYFSTSVSNGHWLGAWSWNVCCHWRVGHLWQQRFSRHLHRVSCKD